MTFDSPTIYFVSCSRASFSRVIVGKKEYTKDPKPAVNGGCLMERNIREYALKKV